ncbi:MAG: tetratricopeptide repeat protein [Pseudonocardiales bacterium]|nr:tetratricopeptide repeat protein [Pseudonocardiales bacterium]MBV9729006.1 tetratricopeptide repeat protein [Pseudonocardiales bacterium]
MSAPVVATQWGMWMWGYGMWEVRPYSERLRGWTVLAGAVLLGVGVGAVSTVWVPGPAASAVGSVLAAAVFGLVSSRGKTLLDRSSKHRDALPEQVIAASGSGRLRRIRELDDPIALRVHPATPLEHVVNGHSVLDRVPPYVPRDVQDQLRKAVTRGGFVLLSGDSTAGKTRAAYEAIRALLPDHILIAPAGRESLATILPAVLEHRRCVVWLDDLERFLGHGGLTVPMVGRLLGEGERQVILLATLRSAEFDRYSAREEPTLSGPDHEAWRTAREVLDLAQVVEIQRRWSPAELQRARSYTDDPRIQSALSQTGQFGLAEVLAAGPELAKDWRNAWRPGAHPRGAALIAAAVDCRRSGQHDPIKVELLTELAEHYLSARGEALLRPEPLTEALAWATTPSHGTSSLLLPSSTDGCYLAFDYLIDLPGLDSIPSTIWDTLIEHATPQQAFAIGDAATQRFQFTPAIAAYRKAADHHIANADVAWANALGYGGSDEAMAVQMLEKIVADRERRHDPDTIGTLRARYYLAARTGYSGHRLHAVELYTQLIADQQHLLGPDHRHTLDTRLDRANTIMGLGDYTTAMAEFTRLLAEQLRVLGADHPDTLMTRHCMANCVGENGDLQRATELLATVVADRERVLGPDHPEAFRSRTLAAQFTGAAGDPARAAEMYHQLACDRERALGPNHRHTLCTRYDYLRCIAQAGNPDYAAELLDALLTDWRRALGPNSSTATIAYVILGDASFHGLPSDEQPVRREHMEVFTTLVELLGPEHEMIKETQRLLHNRLPTRPEETDSTI